MLFSSATFLFAFLPVVALLYYLIPKRCTAARNLFLTGASLLFYAWGEPRFVLVMLLVIVSSWLFACKIEASAKSARKGFLLVAVSVDLTVLFVFKYLGFFTENLTRLPFVRLPVPQITLPIGISFFTFQAISYVVDVYRGEAAQKSLWDVMLYIAFFPQLIAGPIVRYSDFADQIHNRQESLQNWNRGGYRFAIGLGKKVILSNNLAYVADAAFSSVGNLSFSMAWIGAVGYSLQLYFDFSGYSDMAIGLGQMFGFHFLENFNYPFISRSITELWRRWHISLGSWFRDYVYIPLGGSRVAAKRRLYFNIADADAIVSLANLSRNLVIYGHTFTDGWDGGFAQLDRYLDADWALEHTDIQVEIGGTVLTYEVCSVGYCDTEETSLPIYCNLDDEAYRYLIEDANNRNEVPGLQKLSATDSILTLATCTEEENIRLVVVAKRNYDKIGISKEDVS